MNVTLSVKAKFFIFTALFIALMVWINPSLQGHDDGRYYGVAWGMYAHHHFFFPYLNGQLYLDKPPLFFWLVLAFWHLFGVYAWAPQIINILSYVILIYLIIKLVKIVTSSRGLTEGSRNLNHSKNSRFPAFVGNDEEVAATAVWLFMGIFFVITFLYVFRFDLLLSMWIILAIYSICKAISTGKIAIILLILSVIGGMFTKGPVIFVYIFPIAILLPFFYSNVAKKKYYIHLLLSCFVGCIPMLIWFIYGYTIFGTKFSHYLLYEQSIKRIINMGHRSFFWYWYSLFYWLLPWSCCWIVWNSFRSIPSCLRLHSYKLLAGSVFISLILLSLFSQKEPRYILPLLPLLSILLAMQIVQRYKSRSCLIPIEKYITVNAPTLDA